VVQRPVLYLGELNDSQHEAWCRVVEAFDEDGKSRRQIALSGASAALHTGPMQHYIPDLIMA
jgi:hypothetical protein